MCLLCNYNTSGSKTFISRTTITLRGCKWTRKGPFGTPSIGIARGERLKNWTVKGIVKEPEWLKS